MRTIPPEQLTAAARQDTKEKRDVREECVAEALRIISQQGVESLSLREVSRRLNISHQAPYKHFPSRDHILAEVILRAFAEFTDVLKDAINSNSLASIGDPMVALAAIGRAYLEYAAHNPLQYRLMFGTPLPDFAEHPQLAEKAGEAFLILKQAVRAVKKDAGEDQVMQDALFAWSTVHGLASILQFVSLTMLGINSTSRRTEAIQNVMAHICQAIGETPE